MKKIIYILLIISCLLFSGCNSKDEKIKNDNNIKINTVEEEVQSMKVIIEEKEYLVNLEDNETVKALIKLLPQEFKMNELNGNEKYVYLDNTLPTNSENPKKIYQGDVMLYGNNCLVIFYKTFDTSYSYTKIGHIDNLPELGNNNVSIILKK